MCRCSLKRNKLELRSWSERSWNDAGRPSPREVLLLLRHGFVEKCSFVFGGRDALAPAVCLLDRWTVS